MKINILNYELSRSIKKIYNKSLTNSKDKDSTKNKSRVNLQMNF